MNVICDHKDCDRTDATPVEFMHYSRDEEFLGAHTLHFCPEHRMRLLELKETKTLPPAEWFEQRDTSG